MKNKMLKVIVAIFLLAVMSYGTFASYPSYNNETDCRNCHGITVDRHHLLLPNGTYQCTDCHAMKYDNQGQTYYPEIIRNCLTCHIGKNHTDTHHLLVAQGLFVCSDCHSMKYDNQSQTYYPEVIWDCTKCHSTVLSWGAATATIVAGTVGPSITVTSPNGRANYKRGTTQTIKWTNVGSPGSDVKIDLLNNGKIARTITSKVSNTGSYRWTISSSQALGTNFQIRITSTTNPLYTDTGDTTFSITR